MALIPMLVGRVAMVAVVLYEWWGEEDLVMRRVERDSGVFTAVKYVVNSQEQIAVCLAGIYLGGRSGDLLNVASSKIYRVRNLDKRRRGSCVPTTPDSATRRD
jgi:hypothetical protein